VVDNEAQYQKNKTGKDGPEKIFLAPEVLVIAYNLLDCPEEVAQILEYKHNVSL
jgi:hypothetical protein